MTKEKLEGLFDMLEHPEHYTSDEVEKTIKRLDVESDIETMALVRAALNKKRRPPVNVEEAWRQFDKNHSMVTSRYRFQRLRVAAAVTAILLTGLAVAAVIFWRPIPSAAPKKPATKAVVDRADVSLKTLPTTHKDTLRQTVRTFEDIRLYDLVRLLADYYHVGMRQDNAESGNARLYFVWDERQSLDQTLDQLNRFNRFTIEKEGNTIVIK